MNQTPFRMEMLSLNKPKRCRRTRNLQTRWISRGLTRIIDDILAKKSHPFNCLFGWRGKSCLHFCFARIFVPLRRAVAGSAHPRCIYYFKSVLHAKIKETCNRMSLLFLVGEAGLEAVLCKPTLLRLTWKDRAFRGLGRLPADLTGRKCYRNS